MNKEKMKCEQCKGEINFKKNIFMNADGKILCCSKCAKDYTKNKKH